MSPPSSYSHPCAAGGPPSVDPTSETAAPVRARPAFWHRSPWRAVRLLATTLLVPLPTELNRASPGRLQPWIVPEHGLLARSRTSECGGRPPDPPLAQGS